MPDIPFTDSSDDHTVVDLANFASLSLYLVALYNLYVALFFFKKNVISAVNTLPSRPNH